MAEYGSPTRDQVVSVQKKVGFGMLHDIVDDSYFLDTGKASY